MTSSPQDIRAALEGLRGIGHEREALRDAFIEEGLRVVAEYEKRPPLKSGHAFELVAAILTRAGRLKEGK